MTNNTKTLLMTGGAIALAYALMQYYKKNVEGDKSTLPQLPSNEPERSSSFTAGDDFFANYMSDDFFGFTANEPFMNASGQGKSGGFFGGMFKRKGKGQSTARKVETRCESNLERLGRLFPNNDAYGDELSKAYSKHGSSFSTWAQSEAKPCFVTGADKGGLQGGSINMTGSMKKKGFFNATGIPVATDEPNFKC